jgi:hypothetical protein
MRKISDLKPQIPHNIRLMSTVKANNVEETIRAESGIKYQDFQAAVEAFNEFDIFRAPDKIGITLFYPNKEAVTHSITKFLPFDIDANSLNLEIKKLFSQLEDKIPESLKTKQLKRKTIS